MQNWLVAHWVACAQVGGILLLLLAPLLGLVWTTALLLVFLQLPVYMLHQVEEHTGDRFRRFINQEVFGGKEALNPASILWINIPGVWGINLVSLYAATLAGIGWGLIGIYMTLVNGLVHILGALRKGYNPGLWTAIALFVPIGGYAWHAVSVSPGVTSLHHGAGLASAIVLHAAIVGYAKTSAGRPGAPPDL
ncbi:MAG: HXXEE domain-containing protein [Bryobacteraceae bacterium]